MHEVFASFTNIVACFKQLFANYIEAIHPRIPKLVHQEQLKKKSVVGDHSVQVLSQDVPCLLKSPKEVDVNELIHPLH